MIINDVGEENTVADDSVEQQIKYKGAPVIEEPAQITGPGKRTNPHQVAGHFPVQRKAPIPVDEGSSQPGYESGERRHRRVENNLQRLSRWQMRSTISIGAIRALIVQILRAAG